MEPYTLTANKEGNAQVRWEGDGVGAVKAVLGAARAAAISARAARPVQLS